MFNTLFKEPVTDVNDKRALFAACLMSAAGAVCFLMFPILIGGAMDTFQLDAEQGGLLFASYMAGFTLINLTAVAWVRRVDWRLVCAVGYLVLASALVVAGLVDNYSALLATMFASGIGAGVLYGVSMCLVGDSRDPDRYYGAKILAEQCLGAILLWTLPVTTMVLWGFTGLCLGMAASVLLLMFSVVWAPSHGRPHSQGLPASNAGRLSGLRGSLPLWIGLLALFLFFFGATMVWAFMERIGHDQQIPTAEIGRSLSLAVIAGATGAFFAALVGDRFGRGLPLLIATIFICTVFYLLNGTFGVLAFMLFAATIAFMHNMSLAYQFGVVASSDNEGRFAVLMPAAMAIGGVLSGSIGGSLIGEGGSYDTLIYSAIAIVTLATLMFLWLVQQLKRSSVEAGNTQAASVNN